MQFSLRAEATSVVEAATANAKIDATFSFMIVFYVGDGV